MQIQNGKQIRRVHPHQPTREILSWCSWIFAVLSAAGLGALIVAYTSGDGPLLEHSVAEHEFVFSEMGSGVSLLRTGWSTPENWGVWSDGGVAELELPSFQSDKRNPIRDANITFKLKPFLFGRHNTLKVEVYANGANLDVWNFELTGIGSRTVQIPLKDDPSLLASPLKIKFKIDSPASPLELGLSQDRRQLGLGLVGLIVEVREIKRIVIQN